MVRHALRVLNLTRTLTHSSLHLAQQMLLRTVHGYESLKCSTFSGLSKCYKCEHPPTTRTTGAGGCF